MRRKEKELIAINDNIFEVVNNQGELYRKCTTIYEAYERPSTQKIGIYEQWVSDFSRSLYNNEISYYNLFITGANSCFFSIGGFFIKDGKKYAYKITKTRNICWNV